MANVYIGVNNVARKISKIYVGVNNIARKVSKAYVGVSNKARLVYSTGPSLKKYSGSIPSLTYGKYNICAASVNNNVAYFGAGQMYRGSTNSVNLYNTSFTKFWNGTSSYISITDYQGTTSLPSNVLAWTRYGCCAFNLSTAKETLYNTSVSCWERGATTVNNIAIFAGGISTNYFGTYQDQTRVDSMNSSLSWTAASSGLQKAKSMASGVALGNYALFYGGGSDYLGRNGNMYVDAYNSSLTHTNLMSVNTRSDPACTTVGNYAIISGGTLHLSSKYQYTTEYINTSLTTSTLTALSTINYPKNNATSTSNFAIFVGGYVEGSQSDPSTRYSNKVSYFNKSLTLSTNLTLSSKKFATACVTIGSYAMCAGGSPYNSDSNVIDAYYEG